MEKHETRLKGIDISEFNGFIDFEKVKEEVDFVIIRATFGRFGVDKMFKRNVEQCIKFNVPFGFYYYSYALNKEQGIEEAKFFVENTKEYYKKATFPAFIDMEDSDSYKQNHGNPSNETLVDICISAIEEITKNEIFCGIYANLDYFTNKLKGEKIDNSIKWLAWWNDEAESKIDKTKYTMLQHTSKGKVAGIKGNVDLNIAFSDFPKAKEYVERIAKIQSIKLVTGLEDLSIQFMSCYKYGNALIEKIYSRLTQPKIKRETLSNKDLLKVIKKEFKLETKTIEFLSNYIYADFLFEKLYNGIS